MTLDSDDSESGKESSVFLPAAKSARKSTRAFFSAASVRAAISLLFKSASCWSLSATVGPLRVSPCSLRNFATASSESRSCWRSSTRRSLSQPEARLANSRRASSWSTT